MKILSLIRINKKLYIGFIKSGKFGFREVCTNDYRTGKLVWWSAPSFTTTIGEGWKA